MTFRLRRARIALLVGALVLAPHGVAAAQTLADAETELAAGHAAQAVTIARGLVDEGTHVGSELAPIYRVLGLAAATAGQEDAAREAFTRWLALDPEGHLDRSLPDEVRSPFLEARGFWASLPTHLGATVTLREDASGIEVAVVDPASMVARVRARVRVAGAAAWSDVVRPPAASVSIDVAGLAVSRSLDYSVTFLDESGNRIWQAGSDDAPLHVGGTESIEPASGPTPQPPIATASADATGFHVVAVVAAIVAVGAVVGAAVFHADRERLAGVYNGDGTGCTGTGSTRGELCGPQRSAIATDELAAGVLYGVAGAAAITAVILVAAAPSSAGPSTEAAFACGPGPGTVGLACGGRF